MLALAIIAALTLISALAVMLFRNLVHSALALGATFAGMAMLFLWLGAEFVGLAQLLVYVGAVAILIVFAVLLTRGGEGDLARKPSFSGVAGCLVALLVFGCLATAVLNSPLAPSARDEKAGFTVFQLGQALMTDAVVPLQVAGLLLTVALMGAVLIARQEPPAREENARPGNT